MKPRTKVADGEAQVRFGDEALRAELRVIAAEEVEVERRRRRRNGISVGFGFIFYFFHFPLPTFRL